MATAQVSGTRVINGDPVQTPSEAPWGTLVNVLGDGWVGSCSGSIIDATHVLTAAHCTFHEHAPMPPESYVVSAGLSQVTSPADELQQRFVTAVRVAPGYDPALEIGSSDAAVLTLDRPFDFGKPGVRPIAVVPERGQLPFGGLARLYGWGMVEEGRSDGHEHSLLVSVLRQRECAGGMASTLCAQSGTGSSCKGDSGGGLVTTDASPVLVGVLSFGPVGCFPGKVGGYADMASPELHSWLLGNESAPLAPRQESDPRVVGNVSAGGWVSCRHPRWFGQPRLKTLFILGPEERELAAGATARHRLGRADVGRAIACVSVASNAGGTTESTVSFPKFVAGHADELVRVRKKFQGRRGWIVRLALPRALAGAPLRVRWKARRCGRCQVAARVEARRRLALRPPGQWPPTATLLELGLPSVSLEGVPFRASTFRLWLPGR
jgi:hypothetical protein